jgi:alpha-glucosidase (family GH31 glycosyl hydrolase)
MTNSLLPLSVCMMTIEIIEQLDQLNYENNLTYTDIMRNAIRTKYNLLRYYYTELYRVSQNGGTFYKSPIYEFPEDSNA